MVASRRIPLGRGRRYPKEIINPWKWFERIGYKPHEGQRPVHESSARFKVHYAGSRMGKSLCAARDVEPMVLSPRTRGWIVGPTYELGEKEFRYIYEDLVVNQGMQPLKKHYDARSGNMYLLFPWQSEVKVKSADRPEGLLGEELDWLIVSEAAQMHREIWERYLRPRLATRQGRVLFPSTPAGFNWVFELYLRGGHPDYPDWESWAFPTSANPFVAVEEIENARRAMTEETFREQFLGEPTSFSGLVYRNFDRETNTIEHEYDPLLPTFCGVDFGYRFPAALWIQERPREDGTFDSIVFDEFIEDNVSIETFAETLRMKPYALDGLFCDPAGDGVESSGMSDVAHLRAAGLEPRFVTALPWRSVPAGVQLVRSRICNARGERRLLIARRLVRADPAFRGSAARGIWRDIQRYAYPRLQADAAAADVPVKDGLADHTMDALRYYVVGRHLELRNNGAVPRIKARRSFAEALSYEA